MASAFIVCIFLAFNVRNRSGTDITVTVNALGIFMLAEMPNKIIAVLLIKLRYKRLCVTKKIKRKTGGVIVPTWLE